MFHPNIGTYGQIGLDILGPEYVVSLKIPMASFFKQKENREETIK
jgi:ubiquitin-protein ligase